MEKPIDTGAVHIVFGTREHVENRKVFWSKTF